MINADGICESVQTSTLRGPVIFKSGKVISVYNSRNLSGTDLFLRWAGWLTASYFLRQHRGQGSLQLWRVKFDSDDVT